MTLHPLIQLRTYLVALVFLVGGAQAVAQPTPADSSSGEAPTADTRDFVRVEDGRFMIGDAPYAYLGVNFWFGMHLGAESGDRARLERELDRLQAMGVDNLRLLAAAEGPDTEPWRVVPTTQPAAGAYNEAVLEGLDVVLAEMAERDMRGVLVLNNFFQWSGGMAQYVSWVTGEPIPYPHDEGNTWDEFQQFGARFYSNDEAQTLFEDYLRMLTARVNTVTGQVYHDDPTIMAWQLANEPRGFGNGDHYLGWIDRAAALLQRLAPHQLVSLGGEGTLNEALTDTRFAEASSSNHLDYLTVHLWIENWSWYLPDQPETFERALGRAMGYLARNLAIAEDVGKPVVLEEFGVSRDGRDYASTTPVTFRDRFFESLFEALHYGVIHDTPLQGINVWSWSGEGQPREPGEYWQPGDPLTGDPPHERQGWYSIYNEDASTIALIERYARLVSTQSEATASN